MMQEFKIIPILGRKTGVPADDISMFKFIDQAGKVALTHDAGGVNFDLSRKHNACSKSQGYIQWSNSANAEATKCLGLFDLYDGSDRNHIFFDNGLVYYFDASVDPIEIAASPAVTFAKNNKDLYSMIQVGEYIVWADRAEHEPYKWSHGDANSTKLIASGTAYKFRYLETFQRRVVGVYSDQTNGDIDLRWSTSWPGTAITSLNYPDANQLYIPNDDSITGIRRMGRDRCYVYSEDSIHQLAYLPDYESPFRLRNVIDGQGSANHHGILNLGDRHYVYNKNYGFCEFRGGAFPHGGRPISEDIESDLQGINTAYLDLMVADYHALRREAVWTIPLGGLGTPDRLLFYNIDTGQWRVEDKAIRYVNSWKLYPNMTWEDLALTLSDANATWDEATDDVWAEYTSERERLVYAGTDGHLYYHSSEALAGSDIDGYRVEPMISFGDPKRMSLLGEIWFDIGLAGDYSIDVSWRGGDTAGEVDVASWTSLGSISCNSPDRPALPVNKNERLHQIKWGTDKANEKFVVNGITFMHTPASGTI